MANGVLLRRGLRLFLPISAAITLVLLPMAALYEHTRRETLQARLTAQAVAATTQVQATLEEIAADSHVAGLLLERQLPPRRPAQLWDVLHSVVKGYRRYQWMAVFDASGRLVEQASDGPLPNLDGALASAARRGLRLRSGELWLSPVLWAESGEPFLAAVRPLSDRSGRRFGVLLSLSSLAPLAQDVDRGPNASGSLERAYLLSAEGRLLNQPAGWRPGESFAARSPQVWARLQGASSGLVQNDQGLFLYAREPLRGTLGRGGGDGASLIDPDRQSQRLAVVIQVPPSSLFRSSAFAQPAGQAVVVLLYLLAAGASAVIAAAQLRLEALQARERGTHQRLQTVLRTAGVGMCLCDPVSGHFLSVNQALCQFFARTEAELLACTWQQLTHPEDLEADQRLAEQLQRGDFDQYRLRKRFRRPDGSTIWGDLVVSCTPHADGSICDLIAQISDVSELVAKTAYLEAAADAGVVGVWDWDVKRDVLTWDAVMYKLYGRRPDQFGGAYEAWADAIHPDDRAATEAEIQAALKGWRPYQPRFRVIWPDGSIHHLQARSRTSYGPDGTPLRMIGVNYDISDQVEREQEVEQQRRLLAITLDALVDPLLFLTLEVTAHGETLLRVSELNPAAAAFFARSRFQLVGQPLVRLLPAEWNPSLHQALQQVVRSGEPFLADEQPLTLAEGLDPLHVDLRAAAVRDGVVVSFRDVSERRQAVRSLAASEERFRLLAENVTDVVFLSEAGRITWMAPGLREALGWTREQWLAARLTDFCHPDDRELAIRESARVEAGEPVLFRLRLCDSAGGWHWVEVHAGPNRDVDGTQHGVVAAFRVVDREVAAEAELDRRARTDPLTGLCNRQEIFERLERLSRLRRAGDAAVAVLFCDVDHFKAINDHHGHAGGDAVLRALAERLRRSIRQGDLVGRLGGDELLVVLQAVPTLEAAVAVATKIHAEVCEPLTLPGGELRPTLSIGVTVLQPGDAIDAVVQRADQAMYVAKQQGRDRVISFT